SRVAACALFFLAHNAVPSGRLCALFSSHTTPSRVAACALFDKLKTLNPSHAYSQAASSYAGAASVVSPGPARHDGVRHSSPDGRFPECIQVRTGGFERGLRYAK